jgi:hypothetical protein
VGEYRRSHAGDFPIAYPLLDDCHQGLGRNGQRELVISIANRDGSAFPVGVFHYFVTVDRLAGERRLVGPGGITGFNPSGPFGFGGFIGVAYAPATGDHRIPPPPGALQVVLLRDGELDMANRCSPWRVLARMGEMAQFFRGRSGRIRRGHRLIRSATPIRAFWRRSPPEDGKARRLA